MTPITIAQFKARFSFDAEGDPFGANDHVSVYKATDNKLRREVAVKIIQDDAQTRRYPSLKVMAKLFKLEHGHLVHYFDFLRIEKTDKEPGFDVLVMDFISGGDFSQLKGVFVSGQNRERIVEGILGALGVLHQNQIIHGNLKPGNILFQDIGHLHARLSDYGFVMNQEYDKTGDQYRSESIQYLAPEQIEPENFARRGKIRGNADFWALGMLVYELYTGKYAFGETAGNSSELMTRVLHADLPSDIDLLPENYAELVRACLVRAAAERPKKIEELRRILDGKYVWREGRLRKKSRIKPASSTPAPVAQLVPDVKCKSCGQMNKSAASMCRHCAKPLRGPAFLLEFKRPGARGFWAMLFMTALFVPLGFLYYNFYLDCHAADELCNFRVWLEIHQQDFKNEQIQQIFLFLAIVCLLGAVLAGLFFMIWFFRVSANLYSLGSKDQRYHRVLLLLSFVLVIAGGILVLANPVGVLIMLVGLVWPLMMFQEVWRGSNPNYLGSQAQWKKSPGSFMIFSWWVSSLLLPLLVVGPFLPFSFDGSQQKAWFFLTVSLLAVYWILSMLLVIRINRRQVSKLKAWARQGDLIESI